jgi:pimeloyl-ACP methyl ester carboxylesterase
MQLFNRFDVRMADSVIAYDLSLPLLEDPRGLLVVVHGHGRSTRLAKAFAKRAARAGFVLLAPVFDVDRYRDFQLLRGSTGPLAAADALNAACEDAARTFGFAPTPIALAGFSAGAQFAHRYAMCFPERVAALMAASSGWYTMPDFELRFPYGCAASDDLPAGIQDLDNFLKIPVLVMVGENDTSRDVLLRKSRTVDRTQGRNRLERAGAWVQAFSSYASCRGLSSQISLELLPGCGHSVREAVRNGGLVRRSWRFLNDCVPLRLPAAEPEPSG